LHYELDTTDRQLLNALQAGVPLVPRPFAAIGNSLNLDEDDVLIRIRRLKADHSEEPNDAGGNTQNENKPGGLIRQISAIFDSRTLGYQTTLVAARIDPQKLDQAAAIISRHPGVSHNYRRDHAFNLWYTLAVPGDSALGLEATVQRLHDWSGALSTRLLPTIRVFKIGVKLDMTGDGEIPNGKWKIEKGGMAAGVSESDKIMIRVLQQDLPLIGEPFSQWARLAGVTEAELLAAACDFLDRGVMRRFAAVLHHRQAGFAANAMGVWAVPLDEAESFGNTAATFPAVSHCYLRKSYPDWPYTVFTMIHGKTRQQCESSMVEIAAATGVHNYAALYSTKEYKKKRLKYFTPDIEAWERSHP
jgi:siroheme decarboxylase